MSNPLELKFYTMKFSKSVFVIIMGFTFLFACNDSKNLVDPMENQLQDNTLSVQRNRRILVYGENINVYGEYGMYTGGIGPKYNVTDFDENGFPTVAKIEAGYGEGFPGLWGAYPSTVKLTYDNHFRLIKSIQRFNDLVLPHSYTVPDGKTLDPDREIHQEYEYDGESDRIKHELRYYLNIKTGNRQVVYEIFRTFNGKGRLLKAWNAKETIFEAVYDKYNNPVFQKRGPDIQTWEYNYDNSGRLIHRKVSGTKFYEENQYDAQGRLTKQIGNLSSPGFQQFIMPPRVGELVSTDFDQGTDYFHINSYTKDNLVYFASDQYSFDFQYVDGKVVAVNSLRDDKYVLNNRGKLERRELLDSWDGGSKNAYFIEEYIYDDYGTFVQLKQWKTDRDRQNILISYGITPVLKFKEY